MVPVTVSASWPERGAITFTNVSLRYDETLASVVTKLNLDIAAGEKVSGKNHCSSVRFFL